MVKAVRRIFLADIFDQRHQIGKMLYLLNLVTRQKKAGSWNINQLCSGTLAVGAPNPPLIYIAEETLDLREFGFSSNLRYVPYFSCQHIFASVHSSCPRGSAFQRVRNALLPLPPPVLESRNLNFSKLGRIRHFGNLLSPVNFGNPPSNSELLRTL